jgi:hypothetical protein
MEIVYAGKTGFTLRGSKSVSIDAGDADINLCTRRQKNRALKLNGPGEYEVGGVLITTLDSSGTLVHSITLDDLNVVHVSAGAALNDRDLAAIGRTDVLLIQTDDLRAAQAAVADLSPRVVIPFGTHAVALATSVGMKNPEPQRNFSWNGISAPPKAVLLKEPATRRKAA